MNKLMYQREEFCSWSIVIVDKNAWGMFVNQRKAPTLANRYLPARLESYHALEHDHTTNILQPADKQVNGSTRGLQVESPVWREVENLSDSIHYLCHVIFLTVSANKCWFVIVISSQIFRKPMLTVLHRDDSFIDIEVEMVALSLCTEEGNWTFLVQLLLHQKESIGNIDLVGKYLQLPDRRFLLTVNPSLDLWVLFEICVHIMPCSGDCPSKHFWFYVYIFSCHIRCKYTTFYRILKTFLKFV